MNNLIKSIVQIAKIKLSELNDNEAVDYSELYPERSYC